MCVADWQSRTCWWKNDQGKWILLNMESLCSWAQTASQQHRHNINKTTLYSRSPSTLPVSSQPRILVSYLPDLRSKGVQKVWPLIASHLDVRAIQPLNPNIPLPAEASAVLDPQQHMLQNTPPELEKHEVRKHGAVTGIEMGLICPAINIRGDDTLEITPSYHNPKSNTTFIYT